MLLKKSPSTLAFASGPGCKAAPLPEDKQDPIDYTATSDQTVLRYDTTGMHRIQNCATPKVGNHLLSHVRHLRGRLHDRSLLRADEVARSGYSASHREERCTALLSRFVRAGNRQSRRKAG